MEVIHRCTRGVKVEPPIFFQNTDNKNAKMFILKSVPKKFGKNLTGSPLCIFERVPFEVLTFQILVEG